MLRKADEARKRRALWRGVAIASGLILPLLLVFFAVASLLVGAGPVIVVLAALTILPTIATLVTALTSASARGREIPAALDAAWTSAATDIAQQSGGSITAPWLAQKLSIDEARAEELLALVDVNEAVSGGPRMRIAHDAPGVTEVAAAEVEAAIAEQVTDEMKTLRAQPNGPFGKR